MLGILCRRILCIVFRLVRCSLRSLRHMTYVLYLLHHLLIDAGLLAYSLVHLTEVLLKVGIRCGNSLQYVCDIA